MRLFGRSPKKVDEDRIHVTDQAILDRFLGNPDFPWLISFPRTGSHWLRMIMELYFERPSLRRIFFYPDATDFTCYHWHDDDLTTQGVSSVIYLYRLPVDTVYSRLRYHKEDPNDVARVRHWSGAYARHLSKWVFDEAFTRQKTLIRYESLQREPHTEFWKVCEHLGQRFDPSRFDAAMGKVSKAELKTKTRHDEQVVDLSQGYADERRSFRERYRELILDVMREIDPRLDSLWREAAGTE